MAKSNSGSGSEDGVNDTQDYLLGKIRDAASQSRAAFYYAGHVPITKESPFEMIKNDVLDRQLTSTPIVIRWDCKDGKTCGKLTLPTGTATDSIDTGDHATVEDLLDNCAPASFGKDGKDVLDESYRKAVKLDSDQFSTSFSPYEFGIIGAVAQTLLPGIAKPIADKSEKHTIVENLSVIAELYKLNVYSAPSGKFKPHVDTPRGATQFGTLVVCLPYHHTGGQLRVAHGGQEMTYDWSDKTDIQWAAFYSDCEHEVHEVTAGHRITLTYNLYAHEQLGGCFTDPSTIDIDSFTLYQHVKEALASPEFLPEGGTLGFHCVHAYAHANDRVIENMPFALKGVDAMVFSMFEALELTVTLRAVMEDLKGDDEYAGERYGSAMEDAALVSNGLHALQISDAGGDEETDTIDAVVNSWRSNWKKDIYWFGRPGNEEIAVVHLAYGNQTSAEWHYSTAAILVRIPRKDSKKRLAVQEL